MVRITEKDCEMGFPDAVAKIAEKMNGREYRDEFPFPSVKGPDGIHRSPEEQLLKDNGIVVAFGYSDDNIEFRGAVYDEVGSYRGSETLFNESGNIQNDCDCDEDCPNFTKLLEHIPHGIVTSESNKEGYTHFISANFPHATFEIREGGDKYCRGIVFRLSETVTKA